MYTTMMPPTAAPENHPAPTPDWAETITSEALHHLGITDTEDLFSPEQLVNETHQGQTARHQAAADIRDDRLDQIAGRLTSVRGWAL